MIKVLTKNHPHQARFKTQASFSDAEVERAFEYAEKLEQAYWAVQIKGQTAITGNWYEIRTRFNSEASTL